MPGVVALRHRNFRLLWFGQLVSTIGDQMQMVVIGWQLYHLTNSAAALGLVALFRTVPFMTLALVGGVLADSMDRRRLMVATQTLQMAVAVFLVATTVAGVAGAWSIYVAAFAGGALSAFDGPARQALIPNIVPNEDIANALTLNTLIRQSATIVGPGIGGFCIAFLGPGTTYGINALTFLAVIGALLAMTGVQVRVAGGGGNLQRVVEGLKFAVSEPLLLLAMLLDFVTRALGSPRGIMPVFAEDVFHVGPVGLGWFGSAAAVGAVAGGLVLGARPGIPRPMIWLLSAYVLEGLFNAGFAHSPNAAAAWAMLCFGGVCNVMGEVLLATLVQLRTPDHLRGRTTALLGMLSAGGPQFGQMEIGLLASIWGPVPAAAFNGLAAASVAAGFTGFAPFRNRLGARRMTDLAIETERTP